MLFIHNKNIYCSLLSALLAAAYAAAFFHDGQNIIAATTCFILILIALVINLFKENINPPLTSVSLLLFMLWLWLGVSISWSNIAYASSISFWLFGCLPLTFFILTNSEPDEKIWPYFFNFLLIVTLIFCSYAIYQSITLNQRPSATLLNTNSFAAILNLILLPTAGYFLLTNINAKNIFNSKIFHGLVIFICTYVIALTRSRGALISLLIALATLFFFTRRHTKIRDQLILFSLIIVGLLSANIQLDAEVTQRIASISNLASEGHNRFIIWESSWELLKSAPLLGIGFGTFWWAYPVVRAPSDTSGGFYIHNDYLQFWLESGLPAFLLIIALLIAVSHMYIKAYRIATSKQKIEMTALFTSLLTVSTHSMLTFNFYVLPTLLLVGLILGRLHYLAAPIRLFLLPKNTLLSSGYRKIILILACFIPGIYFVSFAASDFYYNTARDSAKQGKLQDAFRHLDKAVLLFPSGDSAYTAKAQLYIHGLRNSNTDDPASRKQLYNQAMKLLEVAEKNNPLRAEIHFTRGELYSTALLATDVDASRQTLIAYETALLIDPRFYKARLSLARQHVASGDIDSAYNLLEKGMVHFYPWPQQPEITPYFLLLAQFRHLRGDTEGTLVLAKRIRYLLKKFGKNENLDLNTVMQYIQRKPY